MDNWNIGYIDNVWHKCFTNFPLKRAKANFYHYTSGAYAMDLLNFHCSPGDDGDSKYLTLWASHFLFLNDKQELKDGLDKLRNVLEQIPEDIDPHIKSKIDAYRDNLFPPDDALFEYNAPNHFILCFCENGNLLSQWKYYGKESGVSIEFDLTNCVFKGFFSDANPDYTKREAYSIDYDDNQSKPQKFRNILYGPNDTNLPKGDHDVYGRIIHAVALASFMKDKSFSEERESRLLFAPVYYPLAKPQENPNVLLKKINYRFIAGRIKPYIEIRIKHKDYKSNPDALPIKSITIGPGNNQNLLFNALLKYFHTKYPQTGYNNMKLQDDSEIGYQRCKCVTINGIKVRLSDIPFRD